MKQLKNWALITGGSGGIGLAFARELATRGSSLVLVDLDKNKLVQAATDLRARFDVKVETLRADLANKSDIKKVMTRLSDTKKPVDVLINCAGFVLHDSLINGDMKRQQAAFAVMAEAVLTLSHTAAAPMKKRGRGQIINIASTSAWFYNCNYSALKHWVLSYTESLALELRGSGVTATAVCPGETKTNFHANGGLKRPGIPKWLWCAPKQIAQAGLKAAGRGKPSVVPTLKWRVITWALRHCRALARLVSRKMVAGRIRELGQK